VVLVGLVVLAIWLLARGVDLRHAAGGVALVSYGPMLALLLIARGGAPLATHLALVALTFATLGLAHDLTLDPARGEPQLVLLALAAIAQIGLAMRSLADAGARDALTGVRNRGAWFAEVGRALQRRGGGAVVLIDLDHFKALNDRFGHAAGDEALQVVAAMLQTRCAAPQLVGRIGGEEFAVFVPQGCEAATALADRLRCDLRDLTPPRLAPAVRLGASFGVAAVGSYEQLAAALRAADAALYRAKAGGRDRVEAAAGS
jgi:diguanylate cyclase (GGDEF)-like protein